MFEETVVPTGPTTTVTTTLFQETTLLLWAAEPCTASHPRCTSPLYHDTPVSTRMNDGTNFAGFHFTVLIDLRFLLIATKQRLFLFDFP